ncbi:hypothetical protein OIDMADRAFT_138888, partial [Oidiodendron maius Zn]
ILSQCDESHPRCHPCTKREIQCSFQGLDNLERNKSTPHSIGSDPAQTAASLEGVLGGGLDRTLELQLFHHYSTVTCITLAEDEKDIQFLQVAIPKLAFSHTFLLDSILAMSALHLAHLEDTSASKFWLQIALRYQNRTLLGFNKSLLQITTLNCEALLMCSIFVLMLTISLLGAPDEDYSDPVSEIIRSRKLLHGVVLILTQSLDTIRSGVLAPWSTVSGLKRLHAVITNTNLTNDERQNQHIYIGACQSLQKVVEAFHRSGSIGRILVWPLYISTSFLSLLEAKDPIALLIFIHYGVALDLISHRWVVQDSGKRLVQALIPSLRCAAVQAKQDWVQIIEWARNTVGLVGGPEDLGAVCEERIN